MESADTTVSGDLCSDTTPLLGGQQKPSRVAAAGRKVAKGVKNGVDLVMSKKGKMVLKCSFAYFLGSLATFVILRDWSLGLEGR